MAPSLILFSALLALSSAALDESPEVKNKFIERPLCEGWSPLGNRFQDPKVFPYQLRCTPSTDGKSVMMSINAEPERGFAHALLAATSESGEALANGKYDLSTLDNYRGLTCKRKEEERAQVLVKTDLAPQAEVEISWTLPDGVKVDDVYCRFFVAEGMDTYWEDIKVPATPAGQQTSGEKVETKAPQTVAQTVESVSEVEASGDETESATSETEILEAPLPVTTESDIEASGDETEATTPETVVLEFEAVDEVGSGDEVTTVSDIIKEPVETKTVDATKDKSVDTPPAVETDFNEGLEKEEEEDFERDAEGRQILTEKAEMKFHFNGEDHVSSYYCESDGTMLLMKRASNCGIFYSGAPKDGQDSLKIGGEFKCAPGTIFNSNVCTCTHAKTTICPDASADFNSAAESVEVSKTSVKQDAETAVTGEAEETSADEGVTTEEPEAVTEESEATTEEPEDTTEEPEATTEEPEATTEEPEATTESL